MSNDPRPTGKLRFFRVGKREPRLQQEMEVAEAVVINDRWVIGSRRFWVDVETVEGDPEIES